MKILAAIIMKPETERNEFTGWDRECLYYRRRESETDRFIQKETESERYVETDGGSKSGRDRQIILPRP